jgi:HAD superfamily hydrolase (TIGR01509 family)
MGKLDIWNSRSVKAIVLDVDGTLYRQGPLRRAMAVRLLAAHATRPAAGWQTLSVLRAYRRAQEHLRGDLTGDVAAAQLRLACDRTRLDRSTVAACVERWMEREPLAFLRRYVQPGLVEFLETCRARGVRLATLSDYPAEAKLEALGVARYFDFNLCAQAHEIGVFKPDPRGLRVALDRLGASAGESLYVGDRADVDWPAAQAAGLPCAILTRQKAQQTAASYVAAETFYHLRDLLFDADSAQTARA